MAAANVQRSAQHALEDLVLGSRGVRTAPQAGTITATVPTAGANACTSVTATVTGVALGDIIVISGPTVALSHLGGVFGTVTATDTVSIVGVGDATGFTGASKIYNYVVFRQS